MKLKLEEEKNDFTQDDNQTTFQKRITCFSAIPLQKYIT